MEFKKVKPNRPRLIGLRLEEWMHKRVSELAKQNKLTRPEIVRQMIEQFLHFKKKAGE